MALSAGTAAALFAGTLLAVSASGSAAPLVDAAKAGDLARVQSLIESDPAAVDQAGSDGSTALHWAVNQDHPAMVEVLLDAGADAQVRNRYGFPAIALAAMNGNADVLTLLIHSGADPRATVPGGESAVMTAARTGDPDAIRVLLAAGADPNLPNEAGQTALMWAAAANNPDAVTALVDGGADLAAKTPKGLGALLFAARAGHRAATEALLDAGADIGSTMATGESVLEAALANTHWDIADLLLDRGADPNQADAGYTALHRVTVQRQIIRGVVPSEEAAIPIGSLDIIMDLIRKMIANGMDVDARMAKDRLKEQRFVNMRDVLFRVGATAFLLAAKEADLELMELLLEAGADPTIPTFDGTTPAMVAAGLYSDTGNYGRFVQRGWAGHVLEATEICLDLGNDVNAINDVGDTALHGAAYRGALDVAQLLVRRGARLDAVDTRGLTPLSVATGVYYKMGISRKPQIAKFLGSLMEVRGLPTEILPPDMDTRCLYCYLTQYAQFEAAKKHAQELEERFAKEQESQELAANR
ncbi:MAG: ankyrin repeat domain-containing protein [Gammaproteobacteria bacterium]|nr:ankyrin repeat domain-containing protein [Gammaproteobacteria bacterium]